MSASSWFRCPWGSLSLDSLPWQTELLRHPVGRERTPTPGPVVGDVIAVLDVLKLDRTRDLVSEALGVAPVHQSVLLAHQNEKRTLDLSRNSPLERQAGTVVPGFGLGGAMRWNAKSLARKLGQVVPDVLEVIGTSKSDTGGDALLECSGARRKISAHAHPPQTNARRVDIGARQQPVDDCRGGDLEVSPNRMLVLGFALSGSVDHQGGYAACQKRQFVGLHLLLCGFQTRHHDDDRWSRRPRRTPQMACQEGTTIRNLNTLPRRAQMRQRQLLALDRLRVRSSHLCHVVDKHEFGEVIVDGGAREMFASSQVVAVLECGAPEPF